MQHDSLPSPQSGGSANGREQPAAPAASENDATLEFASIVATLAREKWLILGICLVVVGAAAGYTYTVSPVYRATSMVRIDRQNQDTEKVMKTSTAQQARDLAGEIGMLRNSLKLARRVAEKVAAERESSGEMRTVPVHSQAGDGRPAPDADVARRILDKVEFVPYRERQMIEIVAESADPQEASMLANVYATAYKQFSRDQARASVEAAREFLEQQADEQRQKIQRLEREWESFARTHQLVAQGQTGEHLASKYNQLKTRRSELSFELENEQTQLELLRKQLRRIQPQLEDDVLAQQQQSGLQSEIQALETRIGQMRAEAAKYYAANPQLEGDTARIQREFPELARLIKRSSALEARKRRLTQQLINESAGETTTVGEEGTPLERVSQLRGQIAEKELAVNQLESQINALDSQIAQYESQLDRVPRQRIQREQIERKMKQAEAFHETIMSELQKTSIAEESELGYIEVVRSAMTPSAPVRPNPLQNGILGLLLGLGFGVGFAFLKEATNTQIRRPEEIEEKGYPLLGVIPSMEPEIERSLDGRDVVDVNGHRISSRLIPATDQWSSITENYRLIQAKLRHAGEQDPGVVFVTSANPGEGKTTTAINLALTGAMSGQRVLLIDADLRTPSAHEMLGKPRSPGLADILEKAAPAGANSPKRLRGRTAQNGLSNDAYMHRLLVEGLYFIPAGMPESGPTKTYDSERLRCFIQAAEPHFDRVIIDTPPTRATSDAIVIGAQSEATAVVVSSAEADGRALDSTMKSLREVGVHVSGVVFNRFDERKAKRGGGYDHSYYDSDEYSAYRENRNGHRRAYAEA